MNKSSIKITLFITLLVAVGVSSRLISHRMNFAPVAALSLLAAGYVSKRIAWLVPVLIMGISDTIIGFHNVIAFTWGSYVLIAVLAGLAYGKFHRRWLLALSGPIAAVIFFLITNFGVWLVSGMYSQTMAGLIRCFTLALPFFRSTLVSDTVFTLVLFMSAHILTSTYNTFIERSYKLRLKYLAGS